ncbi:MAG: 4-diphosphocytidyl-2C-methyl-D-erythritol kinase [Magnetovibrio sp.]|nr:4-diphosphocytidyl-2C-methyl-D-erythritol kinase [Magnetovibrio sp.]|tara:strand:+ start:1468 stop:3009 length:1542 start_codon:yes stop_codon:yes gene_type:complete
MKFGQVPIDRAEGGILAHSFGLESGKIPKGRILGAEDVKLLKREGIKAITIARLEPNDVTEGKAAQRLANSIAGPGIELEIAIGGRVNLIAKHNGTLTFSSEWLCQLNSIDESLTIATLTPNVTVEPGQMVATVKIIPFAVPEQFLAVAEQLASKGKLEVYAAKSHKVGLIQTILPGTSEKILQKTSKVTHNRLDAMGSKLTFDDRCEHNIEQLTAAISRQLKDGAETVLVIGSSAVADRRDIIPSAIEALSGTIIHFGMPVDPGNLMLIGEINNTPVLGVPGCARSPKLNGFDWILQRLFCGLPVSSNEISLMGSGGLLKEIPSRPTPRSVAPHSQKFENYRVYTLVLAAGKEPALHAGTDGEINIAKVIDAAISSKSSGVYVVTGAQEEKIIRMLSNKPVSFAHNPNFYQGLSTSIRRGLSALPMDTDAVIMCLGNSPAPSVTTINALITEFDPHKQQSICVVLRDGRRDNPVLIGRRFFPELHELKGDIGARYLIGAYPEEVAEIVINTL